MLNCLSQKQPSDHIRHKTPHAQLSKVKHFYFLPCDLTIDITLSLIVTPGSQTKIHNVPKQFEANFDTVK